MSQANAPKPVLNAGANTQASTVAKVNGPPGPENVYRSNEGKSAAINTSTYNSSKDFTGPNKAGSSIAKPTQNTSVNGKSSNNAMPVFSD
ncbi:hypothetical protein OC835_000717 [Tilletia horrida]|nr:hypothetical protein OC835_000717 [Tilletia horrida]